MSTRVSKFYRSKGVYCFHVFFDYEDDAYHVEIRTKLIIFNAVYWKPIGHIMSPDFIANLACRMNKHFYLLSPPYSFTNPEYECLKCDKKRREK